MTACHHRELPAFSTVLSGRGPIRDRYGFRSERLQIWFNHTTEAWADDRPHAHTECDEAFVVMQGTIVVEVEGERIEVGPREYCVFPAGVFHRIASVRPPVESFMIRAPSVDDKVYA